MWKRLRDFLGLSSEAEQNSAPKNPVPYSLWEEPSQFSPSPTLHDAPTQPLASPTRSKEEQEILQIIQKTPNNGVIGLNLSHRKITKLPLEIGQLTNLTTLDLQRNELSSFPAEIGQLASLSNLNLYDNQLSSLPAEIGQLTSLSNLNLSCNELRTLPPEIGQLTRLNNLKLSSNQLSTLPSEIGQLTNLKELNLYGNQLSTLPPEIAQLTSLRSLQLSHNRLSIPPEILGRPNNPGPILEYYRRERKRPLNEAKLVLVGQGRVGKTSLVKRLVEKQFDEYERITEGIAIKNWGVIVNDERIKLNIWDFGGQEIMHATHQFFLTIRTLYVLVFDVQKDDASNRIEYWLKLISSFGADSPLIVVSNQIDQPRKLFLNQGELTKTYPNIKAFVNTSCKTGQGLDELVRQITRLIDELAHVRDPIPVEWLRVKSKLEGLRKDYVAYDNYVGLCQANDVGEEQEQRVLIRLLHDLGIVLNFQDDPRLRDTSVLNPQWVTGGVYKIINAKSIAQNKGILEIGQLDNILVPAEQYPKQKHLFILDMMRKFELCFDLDGHLGETFLIPDLLPSSEPPLSQPVDALNFEYRYDFLPSSVISRLMVRMNRFIFEDTYWRNGVRLVHNANRALVKALPSSKKIVISISGAQDSRLQFWTIIREQFDQIHASIKGLNAKVKIPVYKPPKCSNCGKIAKKFSAKFCLRCGKPMPAPRHKERNCGNCGSSNRAGAKFCLRCGVGLWALPAAMVDYSLLLNLQRKGIKQYPVSVGDDVEMVNVRELLEGVRSAPKLVEPKKVTHLKSALEPLRLRVHPQKYYGTAFSLGRLYYEEVRDYTLARQAFEAVHQALEALRGMVQQAIQVQLSAESVKLYEMLVHSCLVEGQEAKAFEYAAAAKGRAFVNKLAEARLDLESLAAQKPDFAAKLGVVRHKRREIEELERQIGEQGANRDDLVGQQSVLLREEAELWREMERQHPALTATLTVPELSAEQACALASELDATLVEYYRHRGGWCAFVVTSDRIRYVPLPRLDDNLLQGLLFWRNNVHWPIGHTEVGLRELDKLYSAAVAPLRLASKRVIFAPFRELHLLPLWAAREKGSKRYLVEDHVISYIPSLTALHVVNQEQKRRQSSQAFERLLSVAYPGTPPLPNVLEEAQAIASRLSGMATVHGLHEQLATPENVLKWASEYDVIHFGCHGSFDSPDPTQWGLQLAQKPLTVSQIITKLNLKRTNLTTLAACLTGEVALRKGEEHIGLLQALMTAGVPTVVASLWAVDDTATRVLFEAFYSRLAMGYAPQEAMRDACNWLRQAKAWKHPFFWASFAVNGLVLPTQPQSAQAQQWPPTELAAQIDIYTRQSIQHRGEIMSNQLITQAEVFGHYLLYYHDEVLAAFQQHPLSPAVAKQKVANGELGIAEALYLIVQDNPALQDFLPPEEEMPRLRISHAHYQRAISQTRSEPSPQVVENSVSDYYDRLRKVLKEKDAPTNQAKTLLQRLGIRS